MQKLTSETQRNLKVKSEKFRTGDMEAIGNSQSILFVFIR